MRAINSPNPHQRSIRDNRYPQNYRRGADWKPAMRATNDYRASPNYSTT